MLSQRLRATGRFPSAGATRSICTASSEERREHSCRTPHFCEVQRAHRTRAIAFSRSEVDGSWHVWSGPVSGGAAKQLTSGTAGEVYPRYARDGSFLVFHPWGTPRKIGRIDRSGGAPS